MSEERATFSTANNLTSHSVFDRQQKFRKILKHVLTSEVIPRVFDASGGTSELPREIEARLSSNDIVEFRRLVLNGEHDACMKFVQTKIDNGLSLKALCLGLFTMTARELGELWLADELNFAEVTMGLGTLHILVHQFSATESSFKSVGARHNIILASAPSEQHAFGVLVVSKIFEMEGWLVTGGPEMHTGEDLTTLVGKTWFDIIGLTASTEDVAHGLKQEIENLRNASLNPDVFVIVGGNGFANHPSISQAIGADDFAIDADDAVIKAESLLHDMQVRNED